MGRKRLKDHRPLVTEAASVATHSSTTRPGGSTVNVKRARPIDSRGRKQNEPASVATHQCKNCGGEIDYNEEFELWFHKNGNCKCNIKKYAEPSDSSLAKTNYQELPKPTESVNPKVNIDFCEKGVTSNDYKNLAVERLKRLPKDKKISIG
jgi:hypothetical protein